MDLFSYKFTAEPLYNGHLGDRRKSPLWRGGRKWRCGYTVKIIFRRNLIQNKETVQITTAVCCLFQRPQTPFKVAQGVFPYLDCAALGMAFRGLCLIACVADLTYLGK